MSKLRLLDLFCCGGGCSVGYARAGFDVVGVDIEAQKNYPFEFHQADALTYCLDGFDAYHASPPCQHYTNMLNWDVSRKDGYPDLIEIIRQRLQATGKPYIIENVIGAPIENAITLCGAMFGLRVYRHRLFESNVLMFQPAHMKHTVKAAKTGRPAKEDEYWSIAGHFSHMREASQAMGIDWMKTKYELAQSIPPAYTEYLGLQLIDAMGRAA